MPRIIEVIVSPHGEVTLQTKGYAGSDCLQATKFLEQALGTVTGDRKTAEFYQSDTAQQSGLRPHEARLMDSRAKAAGKMFNLWAREILLAATEQ